MVAVATAGGREDMGAACPECVAYLGRRNPERFPTIEIYRELLAMYPEPMYESADALEAAGKSAGYEDPAELVYGPSWVWSRPRETA